MLIDLFYTLLIPITHGILNYFKHFDLFKFSFYTLLGRSRVTFSICLILPQYLGKKNCPSPWHNGLWIKKFPCWLGGEYVLLWACMSPQYFTPLFCRVFFVPSLQLLFHLYVCVSAQLKTQVLSTSGGCPQFSLCIHP